MIKMLHFLKAYIDHWIFSETAVLLIRFLSKEKRFCKFLNKSLVYKEHWHIMLLYLMIGSLDYLCHLWLARQQLWFWFPHKNNSIT